MWKIVQKSNIFLIPIVIIPSRTGNNTTEENHLSQEELKMWESFQRDDLVKSKAYAKNRINYEIQQFEVYFYRLHIC